MAPLYKPQVGDAIIFPAKKFSKGREIVFAGKIFLR
jgi:hypothetical protein